MPSVDLSKSLDGSSLSYHPMRREMAKTTEDKIRLQKRLYD